MKLITIDKDLLNKSIMMSDILNHVNDGDIVLIKKFMHEDILRETTRLLLEWAKSTPQNKQNPLDIKNSTHLQSYLPALSEARYIHHVFTFYMDARETKGLLDEKLNYIFDELVNVWAELNPEKDYSYTPSTSDGYLFLPQVIHYPEGGGFFSEHSHELLPQRVGLILAGSDIATDYKCGAVRFRDSRDGEWLSTLNKHEIGDLLLFRFDLYHDITPVDPESDLDFNSNNGRWTFVLPLKKS